MKKIIYKNSIQISDRLVRFFWSFIWFTLFYPSPKFLFFWRSFILSVFGSRLGPGVRIYPSTRIWAPWNLEMNENSSMGPNVICYSMSKIHIGKNATISQGTHLCCGTHDISDINFKLISKPINIQDNAWVAAEAFIGPGITIGEGAVVGARAVVFKDVSPWAVVAGNPAKFIRKRKIQRR